MIDYFDEIVRTASDLLLADGYHVPMLHVVGTQGVAIGPILDMPERKYRAQTFRHLGVDVAVNKGQKIGALVSLVFIFEAWFTVTKPADVVPGETLVLTPPTDDPQRREALSVTDFTVETGQMRGVILEMVRDAGGKILRLEPDDEPGVYLDVHLFHSFIAGWSAVRSKLS